MKIFARTATYSWTSERTIKSARSATLIHARGDASGVHAFGGRVARPLVSPETPFDRQASRRLAPFLGGHWSPVSGNPGAGAHAGPLPQ